LTHVFRQVLAALLLAFASGSAAFANEQVFEYQIKHPVFGDIGTYTNTVKAADGETEVDTRVQVTVNVAGNVIFRQDATRREQWSGERLVAFSSVTQTNEERLEVRGQAREDGFVITSPQGIVMAPAGVRPTNPWSIDIVKADTLLAPMSGRLFKARISDREETIRLADGRARKLRRYEIAGDKRQVVWFDERGIPLAFRSEEGGVNIDFVLNGSKGTEPATAHTNLGPGTRPPASR
jgi:hypothetical protein